MVHKRPAWTLLSADMMPARVIARARHERTRTRTKERAMLELQVPKPYRTLDPSKP